MKRLIPALCACAALATSAAAAAPPRPLADFDVRKAQTLADKLALCDLTAFFYTRPALDADVIITPDRGDSRTRVLRRPYFRPVNGLFDEDLDQAFRRLQARHVLTHKDVAAARARYDVDMLRSYEDASASQRLFLDDQRKLCAGMIPEMVAAAR